MCEAMILGSQKFYCPFKDCSAMLIDDGAEVVRDSECPNCNRMFCAQCKVPWHAGIECAEFKKLKNDEKGNEDIMLRNLAQKNQWRRCPKCRFYVEKLIGCDTMRCRCGTYFCYICGKLNVVVKRT
ncbi:E3 ubiquitin-protein ligase RSL1-like [Rosa rugosa]|uniref:E3 ubiquitin-protein ligase RSL1-like n=1 Tax=Rosa rugosa TaxID=74645 RepID=UPI002B40D50F|nr:E3 ubiquitin-protein ligase RSL1-like [Rosa rugosa]